MSILNPVKYVYETTTEPDQPNVMITVPSDSAAYGLITVNLPEINSGTFENLSYRSYQLATPSTATNERWLRDSSDFISGGFAGLADASGYFDSTGRYVIHWEWVPGVINASDSTYYSLEFFINAGDATVAQYATKVILNVKDLIK